MNLLLIDRQLKTKSAGQDRVQHSKLPDSGCTQEMGGIAKRKPAANKTINQRHTDFGSFGVPEWGERGGEGGGGRAEGGGRRSDGGGRGLGGYGVVGLR